MDRHKLSSSSKFFLRQGLVSAMAGLFTVLDKDEIIVTISNGVKVTILNTLIAAIAVGMSIRFSKQK